MSHIHTMRIILKAQERIKGSLRRICPVPRRSLMNRMLLQDGESSGAFLLRISLCKQA